MLKNIIPISKTESGWRYDGPFSTYPEWHSFTLGLAAGLTGNEVLIGTAVAFATGNGARKKTDDQHWRDVATEPAYACGGIALGLLFARVAGV